MRKINLRPWSQALLYNTPPKSYQTSASVPTHTPRSPKPRFDGGRGALPPGSEHIATPKIRSSCDSYTMHGRTGPPRGGPPAARTVYGCNMAKWSDVRGRRRHGWHASGAIDYRRTRRWRERGEGDLLAGIEVGVADRCGVCVRRLSAYRAPLRSLRLKVVG